MKAILVDSVDVRSDLLSRLVDPTCVAGYDSESFGQELVGGKMLNMTTAQLAGQSFAFPDGTCYYLPVNHTQGLCFEPINFRGMRGTFWAHNWKHEHWALDSVALAEVPAHCLDSMLLMWLLQKGDARGRFGLKGLVKQHFDVDLPSFKDASKGRPWNEVDPVQGCQYACHDAHYALKLGQKFYSEKDWVAEPLALEMALVPIYFRMEQAGMKISMDKLAALRTELQDLASALEAHWSELAPDISFASTKQIQELFRDGTWSTEGIAKTKTGYSTDKEAIKTLLAHADTTSRGFALAGLRQRIQEIRKNLDTYTHSLIAKAVQHKDCRLRPSILQHGTATGRISMVSPNLMQIPARSDMGRRIKACFVPAEGCALMTADYSQIELRVLAHYAGPGALSNAYIRDEDIHQKTADLVGCNRNQAKTINFAYVYGAGPKKLAKTIGVPEERALEFIKLYEKAYPEVPRLRNKVLGVVRMRAAYLGGGYVKTLLGHRRYLPDIANESNKYARFESERQAFNTIIQGSAADIMKKATVRLADGIESEGISADIVCQIHDELTLEVEDAHLERALQMLKASMEGAYPLNVPLVANIMVGRTWNDCK